MRKLDAIKKDFEIYKNQENIKGMTKLLNELEEVVPALEDIEFNKNNPDAIELYRAISSERFVIEHTIVFENNIYKMIKISNTEYKILDKNNNLILSMEGKDFTKEELEEQFNNCTKNCIII
ncbi:hypothetical protein [Clostridium massiliodielmoense]|uniref:hypothetical protein n=1 Tax=Clostridium massiliodielmoense TaxID=1776385 RepID=UPI000A270F79|nr:hypothetical protein [Clostridium massiliodielmoense]